ncbi:hypothetical protein [Protaetiibacter larvae]|uniref:Uncharacterized protein n=1 Tax=Protaetiibacter larvae TaxID=2592654 RepID=A0A5C1Y901_9MICO|nr:hypothetical protein [Protaetiibacter larvae]QEO10563.1 hypothetical protein FLP23_11460 [Protaetiibacter larvae]
MIVTARERQRFKRANRLARTDDQIVAARIARHPDGLKWCPGCQRQLPFHAFAESRREVDGLSPRCFGCRAHRDEQETRP